MIALKFYRDKTHVYINNPNGITKKMSIADFEALFSEGGGSSDIPTYDSSDSGKILTVNNDGTGLEWGESGSGGNAKLLSFSYSGETVTIAANSPALFFDFTFYDENGDVFNIDDYTFDSASIGGINIPNGGLALRTFSLPLGNYGFSIELYNYKANSNEVGLNGISGQIVVINPRPIV